MNKDKKIVKPLESTIEFPDSEYEVHNESETSYLLTDVNNELHWKDKTKFIEVK